MELLRLILRATDRQAEATARQSKEDVWQKEIVAQGIAEMNRTSRLLESSLRVHTGNMSRSDNACASSARLKDGPIACTPNIHPTREVAIPFYPDAALTVILPDEDTDPEAER